MDKKIKGYKIDFTTNTIIMNYTFAAAAEQYGTDEYNLLKSILADFPEMKKAVQKGRNVKTTNKNKNLTYEHMIEYINAYDNAEELLALFETVKLMSKAQKSQYKYVKDWFVKQFPDYKTTPAAKEVKGKLIAMPVKPEAATEEAVNE